MLEQTKFNYTDISNTVYSYGRMQGMSDKWTGFATVENLNPDFANGTFEDLANRVIVSWTSENAINDDWRVKDCNALRNMYNLGHKHSIEIE